MEENQQITISPEKKPETSLFDNPISVSILIAAVIVGICILVGAYMISGGNVSLGSKNQTTNANSVKITDRDNEPTIGSPNAPVTMYEFGDFQCPFCKSWYQNDYPALKAQYIDTGKVKLVFRDFPLSQIHVNAEISSEAAECANAQGQFEAFYNTLYTKGQADGTGLDEASLKQYAAQLGLNTTSFNQCLDTHAMKEVVASDQALGTSLGIGGTPSFVVVRKGNNAIDVNAIKTGEQTTPVITLSNGNVFLIGAQPTPAFQQAIDSVEAKI